MNFVPSSHLFGIFPGGVTSIVVALVVITLFAVWMRAKRVPESPQFTATVWLTGVAGVLLTGFVLAGNPTLITVATITIVLALIGIVANLAKFLAGRSYGRTVLGGSLLSSIAAVLVAFVLAGNLHFTNLPLITTSSDDAAKDQAKLAQKLESELKDQQAETRKLVEAYKEECKKLPAICAKIDGLEKDVSDLQKTDQKIVKILMDRGLTAVPLDLDTKAAAKALAASLTPMGWKDNEVKTGNKINWSDNVYDAGTYAFTDGKPVSSQSMLAKWFKTTKKGKAAAKEVKKYTPKKYHDLFLSGKNMIPVQFTTTSCVKGNTYYADGKVKKVRGQLCHQAGDIWWVPVAPDGTVYWAGAVRADCGNPHVEHTPYPTRNKTGQPYRHTTTQRGGGGHHGCTGSNCGQNGGGGNDSKTGDNRRANENGNGNHQVNKGESTQRQDDPNAAAKAAAEKAAAEQAARDKAARDAANKAETDSGHGSSDSTNTGQTGNGGAGESTDDW